ncbi:metallophosphoesterase [uncultured Muriicola sp.]|uniref:metallophosphoesterase n=1 Tax=uncultured Muriicola sp. TaxID=1583102 RepID=UPI002605CCCF|nr:metallophosphoesterase [uncultured Muriicola sp.]
MLRWIVFIAIYCILGYYSLQAIKTASRFPYIYYAFMALALVILGNLLYQFTFGDSDGSVLNRPRSYAFGFVIAMLTFEIITIVFLFSEDIFRLIAASIQSIFGSSGEFSLPARRRFLSLIAMGIGAIPFSALLYGMYRGKYDFRVLKYELEFDDLPEAFHGYQITQISDIHSGSFDNRKKIEYAVNLINEQQSDTIFFTGDMVNNMAREMEPWKELFATLEAKDGKFSILGNHDYGDYKLDWDTPELKSQNLEDLKRIQREIGFDLMLNESRYLQKGDDKLALIGVENWGRGGFKKAGDLKKATKDIHKDDFKILLSHDPSHWEDVVIHDDYHYHLTLSGHTHGMQFGIEIPGWVKWSPVKWRYKYWAGIYEEMGQMINVNRGFGFIGYPGRVGIWPEITVITLKKKVVV